MCGYMPRLAARSSLELLRKDRITKMSKKVVLFIKSKITNKITLWYEKRYIINQIYDFS